IFGAPPQYWLFGTSVRGSLGTISEILNMALPPVVLVSLAHASAFVVSLDGNRPPPACSTASLRSGGATQGVAPHLKSPARAPSLITNVWSPGAESPSPFR